MRALIYSLLITLFLSGCNNDDQPEHKDYLVMGVSADYPPFEYVEGGKIVGFDIDLGKAISKELGMDLKIEEMDFSSLIPALQNNRVDFILSGITATPERRKNMDFSIPYYYSELSIISNTNLGIDSVDESTGISIFEGKKVGVQLGSSIATYAYNLSKYPNADFEVISLSRIPQLIEELKLNRLNFIIIDRKIVDPILAHYNGLSAVKLRGEPGGNALGLRKDSPLLPRINQAITKLKESGWIDKTRIKRGL